MSLITDDLLLKLWELAQTQQSDERTSAKFWTHLCSKHFSPEKHWVVSLRPRCQDSSGRRGVNFTVDYMREGNSLAVLVFHEAEGSDRSPQAVEGAEARASDACVSPDRYIEVHFPEARRISQAVRMMRAALPDY